jgi:hypothetical protein
MTCENDLNTLLKTMKPKLNMGDFVFCSVEKQLIEETCCNTPKQSAKINFEDIILMFKEVEGHTIIVKKEIADHLNLEYSFVSAWITLTVHSSLEAVGLTAAFSKALADESISCNVVAGYYHDHLFVDKKDAAKAIDILNRFSE